MKRTYAVLSIFNAIKKLVNTLISQSVTHTKYTHFSIPPMNYVWGRTTNTWNFIADYDIISMYLNFKVVTIIKGVL